MRRGTRPVLDISNDDAGTDDGPNAGASESSATKQKLEQDKQSSKLNRHNKCWYRCNSNSSRKGQMKGGSSRGYESGIGSFASKYQPPSFEGEDEKVERMGPSVQILVRTILRR